MQNSDKLKAYLAWIAVCFFWGTTYLAITIGVKTLPVALFSGSRFALAGLLLLLGCRLKGLSLPKGREWLKLGLVGVLLITCANALLVWSSQWISSGMTSLLVATAPFWMAGLEARVGGIKLSGMGLLGILIGFSGMALLIGPKIVAPQIAPQFIIGVIALQVGSFCWCAGSIYSKHYPVTTHPLVGAATQMLLGGTVLMLGGIITGELPRFHFTREAGLAYAYLVVFGSIVGYGCYIYALDKLPAAKVSTYAYVNPVIAVLLGAFWLHEQLDWRILLSMTIILTGVALVKSATVSTAQPKVDQGTSD